MIPPPDLAVVNADLTARLQACETVCLELIAERDRAVEQLGRAAQLSLDGERA